MQQALLQLRCLPILFQQRVYKPLSRTKSASPQATIGHHKANYPIHQKIGARSTTKRLNSSVMISSPKPPNKNNKYHFKLHVAPFCQDNLSFFGGPKNVICESQAFGKWNPKTSPQWSSPKNASKLGIVVIHGTNCRFSCRTNQWHIGKHVVVIPVGRNPTPVEIFKKKSCKCSSGYWPYQL